MSNDDMTKRLAQAEEFFDAFRQMSEMLNGAVRTLTADGWTETQAREVVVATFLNNIRSGLR